MPLSAFDGRSPPLNKLHHASSIDIFAIGQTERLLITSLFYRLLNFTRRLTSLRTQSGEQRAGGEVG